MTVRDISIAQWPPLPLKEWQDTCATLHMYTQVVGKVRLALTPRVNHWWNVPLYVSPRGLTTSAIPYERGCFEVLFDFLHHQLRIDTSDDEEILIPLEAVPVSDFYHNVLSSLKRLGIEVRIWPMPVEVPTPIRFDHDDVHRSYDRDYVVRFWRVLMSVDNVLQAFRSRYLGKCSPVHFFWGSFDLAVTRFSGRRAPEHPGADPITREAYSHEVSSVGWWPGGGLVHDAAFYSYTAPQPDGFRTCPIRPAQAFYHPQLSEFLLMYEDVRKAPSPEAMIMDFAQSTYEGGATLGRWNREELEKAS